MALGTAGFLEGNTITVLDHADTQTEGKVRQLYLVRSGVPKDKIG
jgi:hypothetical protein